MIPFEPAPNKQPTIAHICISWQDLWSNFHHFRRHVLLCHVSSSHSLVSPPPLSGLYIYASPLNQVVTVASSPCNLPVFPPTSLSFLFSLHGKRGALYQGKLIDDEEVCCLFWITSKGDFLPRRPLPSVQRPAGMRQDMDRPQLFRSSAWMGSHLHLCQVPVRPSRRYHHRQPCNPTRH